MKTLFYVSVITLFIGFTSCTPQSILADIQTPQACCGDDINVPPPPPPPPGDND